VGALGGGLLLELPSDLNALALGGKNGGFN